MNWEEFQRMSRVFALTLKDREILNLMNRAATPTLWSEHFHSGSRSSLIASNVLSLNEWVHLALVVEPEASALYLNGVLMTDPRNHRCRYVSVRRFLPLQFSRARATQKLSGRTTLISKGKCPRCVSGTTNVPVSRSPPTCLHN